MKISGVFTIGYLVVLSTLCVSRWVFNEVIAGVALGAIGASCGSGDWPSCLIGTIASLLVVVVSSFKSQPTGQTGQNAVRNTRRAIWHDDGNGTVYDGLRTQLLEYGKFHSVWDSEGNTYTATKHANGDNILTIHLPTAVRMGKRGKRDATTVSSLSASWSYSGTAYDGYTDDDANQDATRDFDDFATGDGSYLCSTLSQDQDDESADISITPQGDGLTTEIQPACGA
ncbi:MAG: hypothetical protein M1819_001629 [Sarea resinae]|nr:MAG: hypothetical protein M1819_001629 [Sarea resinae]